MRAKSIIAAAAAGLALVSLASCGGGPKRLPALGEAYVGPHSLKLRADIPLQSATAATVRHGERLEIVQRRRRFLKVRTARGIEGWTDERQLLAAADMTALRELAERARAMPAQGRATVYGELNVHTRPARQAPSFVQIREKELVDVLMHRAYLRADFERAPLLRPAPKKQPSAKKPPKEPKYPPPPKPAPPAPPANWRELSRTELPPEPASEQAEEQPKPMDYWSLVRLPDGASGWVLTRRLFMAIPDEVAQYAEGRRIVSYFPLGEVQDGEVKRQHWVWTTVADGYPDYDFDGFRVFTWSLRRHRYETAYIERNLKGYAPVLTGEVALPGGGKVRGFSVCTVNRAGERVRREFAFVSPGVRLAGQKPCEAGPVPVGQPAAAQTALPGEETPAEPPRQSFPARVRGLLRGWFGK